MPSAGVPKCIANISRYGKCFGHSEAIWPLVWQVTKILYTPQRASSLVESFNSKLRTVQYINEHVSQEYFWLLALKHNIELFAHGKRKGHTLFGLLGIDLGTNDWVDLVLTYQP